jgi:hypothetical protein
VALSLVLLLPALAVAETPKRPPPTRAQTEEWLKQHIEAWNDAPVSVSVRDCRILITDRQKERSEIVDLKGLLLPVEIIRDGAHPSDATVRLRVKDKASGTYSMFRACTSQNRYCAEPTGKFQSQPWVDLIVTHVSDFIPGRNLDVDKATRLERALEHYANLCGAMEDARNTLF